MLKTNSHRKYLQVINQLPKPISPFPFATHLCSIDLSESSRAQHHLTRSHDGSAVPPTVINKKTDHHDHRHSKRSRHRSKRAASAKDGDSDTRRSKRSGRKSICAPEAEEGSDDESRDSADESDDNAGDLYRSAILGVRNRPNALHQVRAATSPCASCATFAKFLQSFL